MTTPRLIELRHPGGLALSLMDVGATWLSCRVPLADGTPREVLLGCPRPEDYAQQTAFLGATIGRYANRIGGARIARGGRSWPLAASPAGSPHQLHGGPDGFDKRRWDVLDCGETEARFGLVSPDGDQGYPGRLDAQVSWRLSGAREVEIEFEARVDAPCPVGLTSHAYFNLDARHADVRAHRLQIAADRYLPVDAALIPPGPPAEVAGTSFDFRAGKPLAQHWLVDDQQRAGGGYDHAFLLDPGCAAMRSPAAVLEAADASLRMSLFTTLPALQLYAGQYLAGIPGRDGAPYRACAGAALEPEFLPDSPNHPEWPQPDCWLQPGQVFRHRIRYAFEATRGAGSSSRRDSSVLP
jgi:aldose 1-epimerase